MSHVQVRIMFWIFALKHQNFETLNSEFSNLRSSACTVVKNLTLSKKATHHQLLSSAFGSNLYDLLVCRPWVWLWVMHERGETRHREQPPERWTVFKPWSYNKALEIEAWAILLAWQYYTVWVLPYVTAERRLWHSASGNLPDRSTQFCPWGISIKSC